MSNSNPKSELVVLGIDLAKKSFQLHGVDVSGQVVLRKKLSRAKLRQFMAQLPRCIIGLEAWWGCKPLDACL